MSTTASRVVELVRSLPEADQKAICAALAKREAIPRAAPRRKLQSLPDGSYINPNGIPNEDSVFRLLEEIEQQRHNAPGPDAPIFG